MTKTLSAFIFIVVILLLAAVAAPLIDGYFFKKNYYEMIDQFKNQESFKMEIADYQMGYLSSHATLKVTFSPANEAYQPRQFTVDVEISHGPIVLNPESNKYELAMGVVHADIHLPPQIEPFLLGKNTNHGVLQTDSILSFDQTWTTHLHTPSFKIQTPDGSNISWQGLNGESVLTTHHDVIDHATSNLTMGELNVQTSQGTTVTWQGLKGDAVISSDQGVLNHHKFNIASSELNVSAATVDPLGNHVNFTFQLKPLTLKSDMVMQSIGLGNGNFDMTIAGIKVSQSTSGSNPTKNIDIFSIDNFIAHGDGAVTDKTMYKLTYNLKADKLEIAKSPIPVISPISINYSLDNINGAALADVKTFLKSHNANLPQWREEYIKHLIAFISAKSTLSYDASFNTSLGNLHVDGKLFFPENSPTPTTVEDLQKIMIQENIRISQTLANELAIQFININHNAIPDNAQSNTMNQPAPTPANTAVDAATNEFNQSIVTLMKQNKISLPVSMQIIDMQNQHVKPDAFISGLANFKLPADTMKMISDMYVKSYNVYATAQQAQQQIAPQPIPAPSNSPSDQAKMLIDEWIKAGYLIVDKNDYVISITGDMNGLKINGKLLPTAPTASPMPVLPPAIPTVPQGQ